MCTFGQWQEIRLLHTPNSSVDFFLKSIFLPAVPVGCLRFPPFATVEAIVGLRTPKKRATIPA